MDFAPSAVADDYTKRMRAFLDDRILPAEAAYAEFRAARRGTPAEWELPPVVEELKAEARAQGLWNLFLPSISGLSNLEYAAVAEVTGWSPDIAPEAINCQAPDTGNMETLHLFGTPEQKEQWLEPLLEGEIRSAFAMTEPDVASSDATNIQTSDRARRRRLRHQRPQVVDLRRGRRALQDLHRHGQDRPGGGRAPAAVDGAGARATRPGLEIDRHLPTFGYQDQHGHSELAFTDVRVPATNLLGEEGGGFTIAQARLGPGRIHHCMRLIGMAERAIDLMVRRAQSRVAFERPLVRAGRGAGAHRAVADRGRAGPAAGAQDGVADRQRTARRARPPRSRRSRWPCPRMACTVIDRAIQIHGGGGITDTPRCPRSTRGPAPCASPTAPTRCTCARSPARSWAATPP